MKSGVKQLVGMSSDSEKEAPSAEITAAPSQQQLTPQDYLQVPDSDMDTVVEYTPHPLLLTAIHELEVKASAGAAFLETQQQRIAESNLLIECLSKDIQAKGSELQEQQAKVLQYKEHCATLTHSVPPELEETQKLNYSHSILKDKYSEVMESIRVAFQRAEQLEVNLK